MTEREAAEADVQEPGPHPAAPSDAVAIEVPEADAVEQRTPVLDTDESDRPAPAATPAEANEADAAEQKLTVDYDDDDYR